jgi:hypothetical protein
MNTIVSRLLSARRGSKVTRRPPPESYASVRPTGNYPETDLNEAALRQTLSLARCRQCG